MPQEFVITVYDVQVTGMAAGEEITYSGVVESVEVPDDSNPILSLQTEGFGLVKATMESTIEPVTTADLIGKEITIKGECIGILLDVLLNQSIIINQE